MEGEVVICYSEASFDPYENIYSSHYKIVKKHTLARFSFVELYIERDSHYNFEQGYSFSLVIQNPWCQSSTTLREYLLTDSC